MATKKAVKPAAGTTKREVVKKAPPKPGTGDLKEAAPAKGKKKAAPAKVAGAREDESVGKTVKKQVGSNETANMGKAAAVKVKPKPAKKAGPSKQATSAAESREAFFRESTEKLSGLNAEEGSTKWNAACDHVLSNVSHHFASHSDLNRDDFRGAKFSHEEGDNTSMIITFPRDKWYSHVLVEKSGDQEKLHPMVPVREGHQPVSNFIAVIDEGEKTLTTPNDRSHVKREPGSEFKASDGEKEVDCRVGSNVAQKVKWDKGLTRGVSTDMGPLRIGMSDEECKQVFGHERNHARFDQKREEQPFNGKSPVDDIVLSETFAHSMDAARGEETWKDAKELVKESLHDTAGVFERHATALHQHGLLDEEAVSRIQPVADRVGSKEQRDALETSIEEGVDAVKKMTERGLDRDKIIEEVSTCKRIEDLASKGKTE